MARLLPALASDHARWLWGRPRDRRGRCPGGSLCALAQHPAEVAVVTEGRNEGDSTLWGMEVQPARPGATAVHVSYAGGHSRNHTRPEEPYS